LLEESVYETERSLVKAFSRMGLRRARKELKLSQTELAELLGAHRSTVVRWERGVSVPSHDQVLQLVEKLAKPIEWFYDQSLPESRPDQWVDQVPWDRIQQLTSGALRSLKLSSKVIAEKSGLELERVRHLIKGRVPTRKEVETFRVTFGEGFNPTPQLGRPVAPTTLARLKLSDSEKLDLLLSKLSRLEADLLQIKDLLGFQSA
jgi:transcriptional regulator with XRE-family HTH domain